jgi:hypothetical protein
MAGTRGRVASTEALLKRVLRSPSYRGKHVILVHGKVYAAASANHLQKLYDRAVKEYPGETPTLAYVPRADALVLVPPSLDTFDVHFAGRRTTFAVGRGR